MTRDRKSQMLADARRPQRIEGPAAALRPTSHVVVGFDRCPASYHALRFAIELAAPLNAYLHVAHIIDIQLNVEIGPKRLELVRELIPTATIGNSVSPTRWIRNAPRPAICCPRCPATGPITRTAGTRRTCWPHSPTLMTP